MKDVGYDPEGMPKAYSPRETETHWYKRWESQGYFEASSDPDDDRPTYMIAIPPPNVTGTLHMGHACRTTFEDVLIRHKRMQGYNTLWLPGTDHAGIATQVVVERLLKREGKTRQELGREKFIERVFEWKEESGGTILEQLRVMGASCDWSRTRFTMDPSMSRAVREAFVRLYDEGLIYRGTRLVNWDVESQTVLSDLEVETQEGVDGELFDFAYVLEDGSGEIVVSTTRPETMLGDTAVAVHPDDERYQAMHGKSVRHPFVDRLVPIITDATLVDMSFGTGCVKVTPAHDFNDFATGKRHGLPEINILHKDGTLNDNGGPFAGLERFAARKAVKAKLAELGLARGTRKHKMTLPRSQRSGTVVEPIISTQWFVKMEPLAAPAIRAVEDGSLAILPEEWKKTYFHWLRNIEDWCISRQLWWGHSIPAWYCDDCGATTVSRADATACATCGSRNIAQDPDVLDTWFSSALWPFSTLGWPDETPDLARFYPTQDLETGYDILFFWVARMIMMGLHFMGQVPFSRVLLAGLVTDERGDKMSKVKGNVIDPIDVIHGATGDHLIAKAQRAGASEGGIKYLQATYPDGFAPSGADALRMTLLSYAPQAKRIALSMKRIEGYRNFANKLWNASRYVMMKLEGADARPTGAAPEVSSLANRYVLSRLHRALMLADAGLEGYRLDDATQALYHFVWDELCDWYLELSKPLLESSDQAIVAETQRTLAHVLEVTLRAMHPFMPFITEEVWQRIPKALDAKTAPRADTIMLARYPEAAVDARLDEDAERRIDVVQSVVSAVRGIRAEHDQPRSKLIAVHYTAQGDAAAIISTERTLIETLAGATLHETTAEKLDAPAAHFPNAAFFAVGTVRGAIPDVIDVAKERTRLERELNKQRKELEAIEKKLGNASFVDRAPPDVVTKSRGDAERLRVQTQQLEAALARLE